MPYDAGVTPWRLPYLTNSTVRDRAMKRVTIHFQTVGGSVQPPITENLVIRWEQPIPFDADDNAFGIIGERSTFWIPRHAITEGALGQDHPDFNRSGEAKLDPKPIEEELWNLWR